jgi:DNA-binding CsgD family transcriptional regulator
MVGGDGLLDGRRVSSRRGKGIFPDKSVRVNMTCSALRNWCRSGSLGMIPDEHREREAVALVARGLSNEEVAAHMVISPLTAKTHVNRAMTKLGARDRAQLVVLAYESGLVVPGSAQENP